MANVATPSRPPTAKTAKRGDVEYIKENSDYLRHPLMQVGAAQCDLCVSWRHRLQRCPMQWHMLPAAHCIPAACSAT